MKVFVFSFLSLLFTSCFDIIEEVDLNEDGSGQFKLTMDLSQSKWWLDGVFKLEKFRGKKIPSKERIGEKLDSVNYQLAAIEGINNVKVTKDFKDYIVTYAFDFSDVEQLNHAVGHVVRSYGTKVQEHVKDGQCYTLERYALTRTNTVDVQSLYTKMKGDTVLLKTSNFIHILRSPRAITSSTNSFSKVSKSGKAVMTKANLMEAFKTNSLETIKINFQ